MTIKCYTLLSTCLFGAAYSIASAPSLPIYDEATLSLLEPSEREYYEWEQQFVHSLNYQEGIISLPGGKVTLNIPEGFYYLSPEDSQRVLVDGWGNAPSEELPLGMVFPSRYHPLSNVAWGVTINYEDQGHVSDKDAYKIDYDDLLEEMQSDSKAANEWRIENGYEPVELVGWAEKPYYDEAAKTLHWAKALRFGNDETETLNYNLRALGRDGVLFINFIASMDQLTEIENAMPEVLAMPSFTDGNQYADFDPKIDKIAAYGIGGLVAGKVLAKTGLIAAGLIFLKKFGVFLVVGIGALLRKVFGGKKTQD